MIARLSRVAMAASAVAGAAVAASIAGRRAFRGRIEREIADLFARGSGAEPSIVTDSQVDAMPDPVRRWLRWAGVAGKPRPLTVRLNQEGLFRMGEGRPWMPCRAEQYYTTDPPGFVWAASVRVASLVHITGRDRYYDGRGEMKFRLLSLVPVVNASGPEMDQGTLLRYLNETMWFPAAVISPLITWQAIDDRAALATMSYAGVTASATFYFGESGELVNMAAERYFGTAGRLARWETPVGAYGEFAGVRVPTEGEAVWKLESGDFSYYRLKITDLEYNVASMY